MQIIIVAIVIKSVDIVATNSKPLLLESQKREESNGTSLVCVGGLRERVLSGSSDLST